MGFVGGARRRHGQRVGVESGVRTGGVSSGVSRAGFWSSAVRGCERG